LYDTLASRVYGLAMRIVHQPELAEEVVDDTFFQIWREAKRFDSSRGRVISWVLTICRSRALDALRRADPATLMEQPEVLQAEQESAFIDPASILEQFEQGSAVRDALAALPARERQVVALAFFRGMTHQEIADSWSMPLGSVKTLLRRAFGQLREQLTAPASGRMEFL
jgi:RNA polymerase sigma factor (sigma-70 family)